MAADSIAHVPKVMSYLAMLSEMFERPTPLVEGILDAGTGGILAGSPGLGKTWIVLSLALAVASGTPWLGHFRTTAAPVLIIDEEGTPWGMQDRLRMLCTGDGGTRDLPLSFAIGHGAKLDSPDGVEHIGRIIAEHRPALTVFDSLTRVHTRNENDAGEMADVFAVAKALMRRHGTAILFVDHLRKRSLINDPEEMLRGSSEKRAWPETILSAAPGKSGCLTLSHIKSRYHEPIKPFSVMLNIDTVRGSAELQYAGGVTSDAIVKGNEILEAVRAIKQQMGDPDAATTTVIAAYLDCSEDTVRRRTTKLRQAGLLLMRRLASGSKGGKPKHVYDLPDGDQR